MIKLKMSIEDISKYQTGILPKNAVKIETPQSIEEMMKKAAPIAAVLCVLMFVTMLCKTVMNKTVVISHNLHADILFHHRATLTRTFKTEYQPPTGGTTEQEI